MQLAYIIIKLLVTDGLYNHRNLNKLVAAGSNNFKAVKCVVRFYNQRSVKQLVGAALYNHKSLKKLAGANFLNHKAQY